MLVAGIVNTIAGVFGDVAYREDGYGVIGGTDIGKSHQAAYTPFSTGAGLDAAHDKIDHKIQSSVIADKGENASGEHGDEDEFAHSHYSAKGRSNPSHEVITAVQHTGDTGEYITQSEHHEHVNTYCGADQHGEIGHHFPPVYMLHRSDLCSAGAHEHINHGCYQRHWNDHPYVEDEFITQLASLRLRGDNGSVADEGEIVTEKGTSYDCGCHEWQNHACLVRQAGSNRHQRYDSADGRTHTKGSDTSGKEEA